MIDFWDRADVLVCTTIIECGLDIPNVNTLIVERADRSGLAQLYQLRGRVGRSTSGPTPTCSTPPTGCSEQAHERLRAIREHTELGSGFQIAMRDLEIRGAGNLLGAEQTGHIAAVGFDLYGQLLGEAVADTCGRTATGTRRRVPRRAGRRPPPRHLRERGGRGLEAYRRLAAATSTEDVEDVASEWLDRFGPLPPAASGLLELARLRASACARGITRDRGGARSDRAGRASRWLRVSPVTLPASAQVRLRRARARAPPTARSSDQLLVPLADGAPAADVARQRDRGPDPARRCRSGRRLCVACAAREVAPRPPRPPRGRRRRRRAVGAHQRGRREPAGRQRHRHQPAVAEFATSTRSPGARSTSAT